MTCPSLWLRTEFAIFALAASAFASDQAVIDVLAAAQEASHRGDMMALAELGECERAKPLLEAALRYEPSPAAREFAEVRDEARRYLERCAQRNRQHR